MADPKERIYIIYVFLVRYQFQKFAKKTDKIYGETHSFLSGDSSKLPLQVKDYCKKRRFKLLKIISYQALRIESAFYLNREGQPFLTKDERATLPLLSDGQEVLFTEELAG